MQLKWSLIWAFVVIIAYLADPAAQVYSYRSVCIKSEAEQLYHHIPQYLRLPSCFMKLNLSRYSWGAFSGCGDIPLCTAWWGRYKKNGYKKVICRYNVVIVFAKCYAIVCLMVPHNSLSHNSEFKFIDIWTTFKKTFSFHHKISKWKCFMFCFGKMSSYHHSANSLPTFAQFGCHAKKYMNLQT